MVPGWRDREARNRCLGDVRPLLNPVPVTHLLNDSRYLDQAAVETHKTSSTMAWLVENNKKEDNMAAPIMVMPLEQFAGWENRARRPNAL